jgi:chromosome segregation ATPase
MLKNLVNEINNLLLDNEEKTQEILSLNSSINSLNTAIEVLQNENQSLLDVKVELTNRILELEEQVLSLNAEKEKLELQSNIKLEEVKTIVEELKGLITNA